MEPKQQKFSIGYVIATLLALLLIQAVFFQPQRLHARGRGGRRDQFLGKQ
jgi:hypothetical protein